MVAPFLLITLGFPIFIINRFQVQLFYAGTDTVTGNLELHAAGEYAPLAGVYCGADRS